MEKINNFFKKYLKINLQDKTNNEKKKDIIFYFIFLFILMFIFYPYLNTLKEKNFSNLFQDTSLKDKFSEVIESNQQEILSNIKALAFLVGDLNSQEIILEKNAYLHLYPASITKLVLAMVAIDQLPLDQEIEITPYILSAEGEEGDLRLGEIIKVKDLLHILLITSSNDAALALEEAIKNNGKDVIDLMNKKIRAIDLKQTAIFDPRGIDRKGNFSTAFDLYLLAKEIYKNYPLIGEITKKSEEIVFSSDQKVAHVLKNTNLLASELNNLWGGKTGTTPEAGDCLLTIFEFQCYDKKNILKEKKVIAIIILNSKDRFQDAKNLYNFLKNYYFQGNCL